MTLVLIGKGLVLGGLTFQNRGHLGSRLGEVSSLSFRDAKHIFYTRTFQFGCQKVPLPGCQFTIP